MSSPLEQPQQPQQEQQQEQQQEDQHQPDRQQQDQPKSKKESGNPNSILRRVPDDIAEPVRIALRSNEHFKAFLQRQADNHREYSVVDRTGQLLNEAVDESSEDATTAAVVRSIRAGHSHSYLVRAPHTMWFTRALEDFLKRKHTLVAGGAAGGQQSSSSAGPSALDSPIRLLLRWNSRSMTVIAFLVALCGCLWLFWPLWDFLVAIQANEHYRALGLEPGAKLGEINQAYRRLTREIHPDRNPGCGQRCVTKMMEVKKAYEVLKGKDEASELQNQIDGMMAQIVMFIFGDVFAMVIHTGIFFSGLLLTLCYGTMDLASPSGKKVLAAAPGFFQSAVRAVDYGVRGLLLACGIGLVIYVSDKNVVSLIAVGYAVVNHLSAGASDSIFDIFRYRGFQPKDTLVAVLLFAVPATALHVGPAVAASLAFASSSEQHFAFETAPDPIGWTVLVALLGACYVCSAIFVSNPCVFDNIVMMRVLAPVELLTAVSDSGASSGDGDGGPKFAVTFKSTLSFIFFTVLKRDVLAFALRVPAPYRVAAVLVYATVFVQMMLFGSVTERPPMYDPRFRRADEAAKRLAAQMEARALREEREERQQANVENSNSNNNNGDGNGGDDQQQQSSAGNSTTTSSLASAYFHPTNGVTPPATLVAQGAFAGFDANDVPVASSADVYRMNDTERQLVSSLDEDVPFWAELVRLDTSVVARTPDFASNAKFHGLIVDVAWRDMDVCLSREMRVHPGATLGTAAVQNRNVHGVPRHQLVAATGAEIENRRPALPEGGIDDQLVEDINSEALSKADQQLHYGAIRARRVARRTAAEMESLMESEVLPGIASVLGVLGAAALVALLLSLTTALPHIRATANKVFMQNAAASSHAALLRERQKQSVSLFDCAGISATFPVSASTLGGRQRRGAASSLKLCRSLLALDPTTNQETTHTSNIYAQQEGRHPLQVIDFDAIAEAQRLQAESMVRMEEAAAGDSSRTGQQQQQRGGGKQQQQQQPPQQQHSLTRHRREQQQQEDAARGGGPGGLFSFSNNGPPDSANPPDIGQPQSQADMDQFMKFAQELEKRQRARGYRPKFQRPQHQNQQQQQQQQRAGIKSGSTPRISGAKGGKQQQSGRAGKASSASYSSSVTAQQQRGGRVDEDGSVGEFSGDENENDNNQNYAPSLRQYQGSMFVKMQRWMEGELAAGRISVDLRGRIKEQDMGAFIEWMMENDESWEPDPNWKGNFNKNGQQEQLGGPAAEELRRLRGGAGSGAGGRKKRRN